ncbi:permease [Alicyclobacillus sp.]|uniref:permease n=1 Tax=Alicyclobacillus sp. TaxID=61169 RepID=UPI0025C70895|nr:permease [Alicyclobacillus sp.]
MLLTFTIATAIGYVYTTIVHPDLASNALEVTVDMFLQSLPWIVVSMFMAGLLSQVIDPAALARWLGREAGFSGIVLGALLGMAGTGSRWAMYPLAAGLLASEASPGAVFAFVTSWQLVSLTRLPAEVPFYGVSFTIVRAVLSFLIAVAGGVLLDRIPFR